VLSGSKKALAYATAGGFKVRYAAAYPERASLRAFGSEKALAYATAGGFKVRYAAAYPERASLRAFGFEKGAGIRDCKLSLLWFLFFIWAHSRREAPETALFGASLSLRPRHPPQGAPWLLRRYAAAPLQSLARLKSVFIRVNP
jgi:hypothetical protein